MQDKINKIRQECIKTNPEIVELKFGCKVKHKTMYGKSIFTICRKLDSVSFYVYRNSFKYLANSFTPPNTCDLKNRPQDDTVRKLLKDWGIYVA